MGTFSHKEVEYVKSQRLARVARADAHGSPHVVPVDFRVSDEGSTIDVGGHDFAKSKKWRDLQVNSRVAIVIDDLASVDPWTPRGLEVRGTAELHDTGGEKFGTGWAAAWARVVPHRVLSWGIEAPPFTEGSFRSWSVAERSPQAKWSFSKQSLKALYFQSLKKYSMIHV